MIDRFSNGHQTHAEASIPAIPALHIHSSWRIKNSLCKVVMVNVLVPIYSSPFKVSMTQ